MSARPDLQRTPQDAREADLRDAYETASAAYSDAEEALEQAASALSTYQREHTEGPSL